ncbi:uncharacterized protein LOC142972842 isoform X2 [Anticarsia gemmatalis]
MNNPDWNTCPPEILCIIFRYFDTRTLSNCLLVNKNWRSIAEHVAERYKLWETIVNNEMVNSGASFRLKSTLDFKDIFMNSLYWNNIKLSNITHLKTYEIQNVKKINVYKDNLILITKTHVLYYNIKNFCLIRAIDCACINFEENDDILAEFTQEADLSRNLRLYLKPHHEFDLNIKTSHRMREVRLYCLARKCCYVFCSANVMWVIKHGPARWNVVFLGKHYGVDADHVTAMNVCNENILMMTKRGAVWHISSSTMGFRNVYLFDLPHNLMHHNWTMFDRFSCIVTVGKYKWNTDRVVAHYDRKSDSFMLKCRDMTCATVHGKVLFLGYSDGRVEIRIPRLDMDYPNREKADRYFNIQEFYRHVDDSTIIALNVYEAAASHTLFVSTQAHVFQFQLTYPEYLF